jgi:hypothetical protein
MLERLPWNRRAHWRPAEGVERGVFTEWEELTPGPGEPPYAEDLAVARALLLNDSS